MRSSRRARARRATRQDSHYQRFLGIRDELARTAARRTPGSRPHSRPPPTRCCGAPPRPEGRVWIENPDAVAAVDLANASYGLMLRLLALRVRAAADRQREKSLAVDLAIGLMRAIAPLAEQAARLPAGPSNPHCNAGHVVHHAARCGGSAAGARRTTAVRRAFRATGAGRRRAARQRRRPGDRRGRSAGSARGPGGPRL